LPGQPVTCTQAIDPEVAHAAIYAMKAVMSGGTGSASNPGGVPIFGKTGTTDSSTQTWIVASTSRIASVAWVGNIIGKYPLRAFPNGSFYRHQIMSAVMGMANQMYPGGTDWLAPPSRLLQGSGLKMPDVEGLSVQEATALLVGLGLKVKVAGDEPSDYVDEGYVARSDPASGELAAGGMLVRLYLSSGIEFELEIPDVVGLSEEDAVAELESAGVSVSVECSVADDPLDLDIGSVVDQSGNGPVTITILKESCP
jgi:membrane peptidoglycan carboxypeptidase